MNKYDLIYADLVGQIEAGTLSDGARVPSESTLIQTYSASRGTVRRAVELLQERGYVQKMHGKGVFVLRPAQIEFRASAIISFQEVNERLGRPTRTHVVDMVTGPADLTVADRLGVAAGTPVHHIKRVRTIDDEAVILDLNWFDAGIVPNLDREIAQSSIYRYIEGELGLQISYAERVIEAQETSVDDRRYLCLNGLSHVIVVRNRTHLYDGRPFEYTESRHRLDRFQFADVARR